MANRMKRRSVMLGLGALAAGSGATFVSGAFDSATTAPGADLRVISDGQVTVRGNADVDDDVHDLDDDSSEDIDFGDPDGLPRATFADTGSNINDDIDLKAAINLREDGEFESLLEVENQTEFDQEIAIHFEEGDEGGGDDETYGDDVEDNGGDIDKDIVQEIYQFRAVDGEDIEDDFDGGDDDLISPKNGEDGIDRDSVDNSNTANTSVTLKAGGKMYITLDFFTDDGDIVSEINSEVDRGGFGDAGRTDADLLDSIVVEANQLGD